MNRLPSNLLIAEVEEKWIVSKRFLGKKTEIKKHFQELDQKVGDQKSGPGLCLFYGSEPDGLQDIEVCFPIHNQDNLQPFQCRILAGGEFLYMTHQGNYNSSDSDSGINSSWKSMSEEIQKMGIGIATGPAREVYSEFNPFLWTKPSTAIVEIQLPIILPRWLKRLEEGLISHVDEISKNEIMAGSESLTALSSPENKSNWAIQAMSRLDVNISDFEIKHKILCNCSHRFPPERINKMKCFYDENGNLDQLLDHMNADQSWQGISYYEYPERRGNHLFVEKIPYDHQTYSNAPDDLKKKAAYCHCSMIRSAILNNQTVSRTFCSCGAGWYQDLWEGIFGCPVKVKLIQSILTGSNSCQFSIEIPDEII
ncbi:MAG: GyrI-like domain-containing protein [Anaerolineaceae bacterium]|nr:GyrI-like domain-containing protein [Anaerolineaceae bacterium]